MRQDSVSHATKITAQTSAKSAIPAVPSTENPSATISTSRPSQTHNVPSKSEEENLSQVFDSKITGYGDDDLEISLLAGIMKDNFILENLKGKGLTVGLFSTRYSRAIFKSILALREESPDLSSLDRIVLKNKLKQLNLLDTTIQNFLEKVLEELPPMMDQAMHYLELMKEQALKRKLKEIAHEITEFIDSPPQSGSGNENENLETFTNKIIQNVRNIQKARATKRINLVREEMRDIVADIEKREITGEIDIIGYSFEPMHYLNTAISGFRKGFMYAIAGAPRRGKTTFTLELATRVASLNKIPVLFFTYEQTKKNLTYRLLAKESRLNPDSLQRKKIKSDMIIDAKFMSGWQKMQEYMDYFYIIEATKEDTVDRIRSYAYNVMQDFNTEDIMIFVDYIQKMPLSRNYNDEKFKVEEISTELKGLSIELNNPIMTISSLSKEGCMIDATPDAERPTMYHCKGSGDLEYDLDCAMIQAKDWGDTKELYQQLQHKAEELGKDSTRVPKVDVVNLYLDKNRDAPEGIYSTIQYLFFIEDNKFIELGPKFEDDRFRFSKIEELVDKLIQANFIVFYDKPKDSNYNKGRVSIKLKNF
ncbi:MAG: replicative DNA helicase [Candidatus Rifleibacteriota bacterium]